MSQSEAPAESDETEAEAPAQTLLEQMGGISGLIYSSVPVLVFVGVYLPTTNLAAAIWSSVAGAVAILVWRLIRREPVQPAISGLVGVAIAAFIAYRTGSARGYFAFGIWTSLAYGGAFLVSVLVRWPLAGVVWAALNSTGMAWRSDKLARRYYDVATGVWVIVFGARFVVQEWLYQSNQVGWLAVARIGMGWPLTAVAALVTVWAVRKADQRVKVVTAEQEAAEPAAPTPDTAAGAPIDADPRTDPIPTQQP
ncbi:MAG TPA: DUF3159 domain-containing protein [Pseudonocardiaceae bacterium]|jgi:hypothetical protein|nr:DUF3159 domain-containing protein [Pseudonocardiaceae bacterium]